MSISKFAILLLIIFCTTIMGFREFNQTHVSVVFPEYGITLLKVPNLGDTINFNKSSKEDFKFVFYDNMGKCYCERYLDKKLYEKGDYGNSLDTLKKYISTRFANGKNSRISVQKYLQPLKDGNWIVYKGGKKEIEKYKLGILTID